MTCPVCQSALEEEKGKMNLRLSVCRNFHGSFVDPDRLRHIVEEDTTLRIRDLTHAGGEAGSCPNCGKEMRQVDLGGILTDACASCGGLWFATPELTRFHQEWRHRAYGQNAFVSRAEVMEEATKLHAAEVISGVLTEFELSLEE